MRTPIDYGVIDPVERITIALHDAAFEDTHWPRAMALIDDACQLHGSHLALVDTSLGSPEYLYSRFFSRGVVLHELERDYASRYFASDERIPRMLLLPVGCWLSNSEVHTDQEPKTTTYDEVMERFGGTKQLQVRLNGLGDSHIFWTVTRLTTQGDWRVSQLRILARLLPHVRHAVQVRQALAAT